MTTQNTRLGWTPAVHVDATAGYGNRTIQPFSKNLFIESRGPQMDIKTEYLKSIFFYDYYICNLHGEEFEEL